MSTGILDNNVPVSDAFLPPQPVVQSPAQYPYLYPELQPPVYQEALPAKIVLPTLPQIMLSSSETQTDSVVAPASSLSDRRVANRYSLNDFVFQHTLGTGSFGRVHLVQSKHNLRFYAVKVLAKEKVVRLKQVEHTNSERGLLGSCKHPFLVNLWGTFQDANNLFMVMDFVAGGELFTLIRKSVRFPPAVAKFYAAEVAVALEYLHGLDIIYRDLKPENILIGQDGHIKLTDFGFAKRVKDQTYTLCGTPDYLAPESVDWYAWGVLIYEMLAGYPPFYTKGADPASLYKKIIEGRVRYPQGFDAGAYDLVQNCLTADLSKRYGNLHRGSVEIFRHPWFSEVEWDLLLSKEIPAPYIPDLKGEGDSSQFETYAENDTSEYGAKGRDEYADLFRDFD
ncbi:hypothetical protein BS47DRAFT_1372843 [Hydnum rufescens UP504]|uniref:cAMP-dependent protein kinase n=1 Tax=Hydnum rufescens UP504 TaxID=1448309 RepID=A0A9P6AWX5_9AGAM|nr:hypothetical protein BS47DRAFT_1372843 [Hydnum rufescens UP504]